MMDQSAIALHFLDLVLRHITATRVCLNWLHGLEMELLLYFNNSQKSLPGIFPALFPTRISLMSDLLTLNSLIIHYGANRRGCGAFKLVSRLKRLLCA